MTQTLKEIDNDILKRIGVIANLNEIIDKASCDLEDKKITSQVFLAKWTKAYERIRRQISKIYQDVMTEQEIRKHESEIEEEFKRAFLKADGSFKRLSEIRDAMK